MMTLTEFADMNDGLVDETPVEQVLAIAWYWRTYDPTHELTYTEIQDAFKELGLDSSEVSGAFAALHREKPKQLLLETYPNNYKLAAIAMRRLNAKYVLCRKSPPTAREAPSNFALTQAERVADVLSSDHIIRQLTRMENGINDGDTALAIGTAKEFVETICKTVLDRKSVQLNGDEELTRLTKITLNALKLMPEDAGDELKATRILLGGLGNIPHQLAVLRNLLGTGHGRHADTAAIDIRFARLAVGAAITFGVFIFDTLESDNTSGSE
jgi:Abortive infection C-terminus